MASKEVLVNYLCYSRPVKFTSGNLKHSVVQRFSDKGLSPTSNLTLQIKSEKWSGLWVDVEDEDDIPDMSVLQAVKECEAQV